MGGDVLARGDEPGLRSPLADALALAACTRLHTPARLLVAGPGLDGELTEADVLARCHPEAVVALTAGHVGAHARVLDWHPSEATGLLAAAARGNRGTVEVRDQGLQAALSDHSHTVHEADWATVAAASKLVPPLRETDSLGEAEEHTRRVVGFCETDAERRKAARLAYRPGPELDVSELHRRVADFEANARARGADYVTLRRLAEALDLSPTDRAQLLRARPDQPTPSLWSIRPTCS